MTIKVTPNRGIRYPDFAELGRAQAMRMFAEDLDAVCTKTDALRTAALRKPRARVWRAAGSQSITKNTWTQLTGFDTALYDNNGQANLGVNNDRLTVQTAGVYLYVAMSQGNTGGTAMGSSRIAVAKNAATNGSADFTQKTTYAGIAASQYNHVAWAVYLMAVNDSARVWVYWNGAPAGPASFSSYSLTAFMLCTNP